ncbi:MAG: ATP-binding protein, partial [Rhizobiales bacterium]|nr:ATP-binding protein [Hyphomicrobiales bacterium]
RESLLDQALAEILANPDAAFRADAELFQDFLVRCRIRRVPGAPLSLPAFRRKMAVARSGVDADTAATEVWARALDLSRSVTEDLQGVFLLVSQAAVRGLACPSDARIARAYGTHSARRARRLLGYFEGQGLVVVHSDLAGHRIVAFPDLGCETLPGDANGPDLADSHRDAAE